MGDKSACHRLRCMVDSFIQNALNENSISIPIHTHTRPYLIDNKINNISRDNDVSATGHRLIELERATAKNIYNHSATSTLSRPRLLDTLCYVVSVLPADEKETMCGVRCTVCVCKWAMWADSTNRGDLNNNMSSTNLCTQWQWHNGAMMVLSLVNLNHLSTFIYYQNGNKARPHCW